MRARQPGTYAALPNETKTWGRASRSRSGGRGGCLLLPCCAAVAAPPPEPSLLTLPSTPSLLRRAAGRAAGSVGGGSVPGSVSSPADATTSLQQAGGEGRTIKRGERRVLLCDCQRCGAPAHLRHDTPPALRHSFMIQWLTGGAAQGPRACRPACRRQTRPPPPARCHHRRPRAQQVGAASRHAAPSCSCQRSESVPGAPGQQAARPRRRIAALAIEAPVRPKDQAAGL